MKVIFTCFAVVFFVGIASAQSPIVGNWYYELDYQGQTMRVDVEFTKNGTFSADADGDGYADVTGKYTEEEAGTIVVQYDSGQGMCSGKGTYTYVEKEDGNLSMTMEKEECPDRALPGTVTFIKQD
ncbi:MAG: hypothetical protein AAFO07_26345 [Bacteroidota bacterium]